MNVAFILRTIHIIVDISYINIKQIALFKDYHGTGKINLYTNMLYTSAIL